MAFDDDYGLMKTTVLINGAMDAFNFLKEELKNKTTFRGLDSVREDLRKRGIKLEDLCVTSDGVELEDLFHPSAKYTYIERFSPGSEEKMYGFLIRHTFGSIKVCGGRKSYFREKQFNAYLEFSPAISNPVDKALFENPWLLLDENYQKQREPIYRERIRRIDEKLKVLELFFQQRMESQQPQYNYTYRSRTEIKNV